MITISPLDNAINLIILRFNEITYFSWAERNKLMTGELLFHQFQNLQAIKSINAWAPTEQ